jgi:hypothetical protein
MSLGPFGLLLLRFHLEDVELVMLLFAPRFAVVAVLAVMSVVRAMFFTAEVRPGFGLILLGLPGQTFLFRGVTVVGANILRGMVGLHGFFVSACSHVSANSAAAAVCGSSPVS